MAEAIVSVVVGRLTDLSNEEAHHLHGVKDEIQQVVSELIRMKTFLPEAVSRINVEDIRILLADVREVAYDAENVIESFLVSSSTARSRTKKMKNVQTKMSLLFDRFGNYGIRSTLKSQESINFPHATAEKLERFYSYTIFEPDIYVETHGIVDSLVGHLVNGSDDCYPLISICGMGGLGKTTLAEKIYNHSTIKSCFVGLAWVSISQKWQAKHLLRRILICLIPEKEREILTLDDAKLVNNLLQIQEKKKCLIVLDDIWTADAWDSIKGAFAAEKSLSKLMLTSRNIDVPKHVNPKGLVHQPDCLDAEQSWKLLQFKALPKGGDALDITRDVEKMKEMGRKMVGYCAGLPLAIVMLGGILVTKPSLIEWEKVYRDTMLSLEKGKELGEDYQHQLLEVLVWSYNDLPPQLKPCFLYLGKFNEDEWIEVETLYQLWIAEGMVLSSDKKNGETMMQVAESYMGELVHRSMVQVKHNDVESSLTMFKSCSLHDLMRDLSLNQAKEEDLYKVIDLREKNNSHLNASVGSRSADTRQLVVYFDEEHKSKKANHSFGKKANQQRYRSMLLFNRFKTRSVPPVLGSDVANFRLLRVFALEEIQFDKQTVSGTLFRINLGKVLGSLVYLRYLSVRKTNLLLLPAIQKLVLLQTLKLDVRNDVFFPPWLSRNLMSKLGHLRHLYLPDWKVHSFGKKSKLRFNGLSKLETLENVNTQWCEVKDLPVLTSLHKLTLRVDDSYDDVEEVMKYLTAIALSSTSCLRYLVLTICECDLGSRNGPDILRKLLSDHKYHLRELKLIGQLPELAQLFEQQQQQLQNAHIDLSLIHITRLHLMLSFLKEDPMPVLEKIPALRELLIHRKAYMGEELVCSAKGFPKLTRLVLRNLPNLVEWRVEKQSMPVLSHLMIRRCPKLEELPEGIKFLHSLRELRVEVMPLDFYERLKVVNAANYSIIVDID